MFLTSKQFDRTCPAVAFAAAGIRYFAGSAALSVAGQIHFYATDQILAAGTVALADPISKDKESSQ